MNNETRPGRRKDPDPEVFRVRLEALLGHLERLLPDPGERLSFRESCVTPLPTALRLNRLVAASATLRPILNRIGRGVPWCADAYTLSGPDRRLGHTLEYALGAFYLQAAATTLAVSALDPQPGERVLDLCAAPGGKATQIAAQMGNHGLLVINELQRRRFTSLIGQLERCGVIHGVVTKGPGPVLARYFPNYFDRVLVDAPCSGDGIVRKDQQMLEYWSPQDARQQAQTQIGLLRAAFHMLRPGGVLVYSTCSLSVEENEEVLLGLFSHFPGQAEVLPIAGIDSPPLPRDMSGHLPAALTRCVRVWPHRYDTEGAFVACLRKSGSTAWPHTASDARDWPSLPPAPDGPVATRPPRAGGQPTPGSAIAVGDTGGADPADTTPSAPAPASPEWLRDHWGLELADTPGQTLVTRGKYISLEPTATEAFRQYLPSFVRGGMRVGHRHHRTCFLSQQSVVLWGSRMVAPRVELSWDEVRTMFRGESVPLPTPRTPREEVLCTFGPWVVCRGQAATDGLSLVGMVPHAHLRPDLTRLG